MLEKLDKIISQYEDASPLYAYVYGECPDLERCENNRAVWEMDDRKLG